MANGPVLCAGRTAGASSIAGVIVHIPAGIGVLEARIHRVAGGRTCVAKARLSLNPARVPRAFAILFPCAGAGVLPDLWRAGRRSCGRKTSGR